MQLEINNYSVYMKKSTVIHNVFDYVVELSMFFFRNVGNIHKPLNLQVIL